ncbi:hypothetical protein HMPREF6123_1258 [Oribacterium sinus F0268]|uniref:Uncharacterized protein n=1 Tax=Oribacterium sinus F0268 TaxID=585501 RepID=C2KXN9_9FIRM|nr:hypothetical protein HMPREF6123_1258 [Oribacterium sinus F0268]
MVIENMVISRLIMQWKICSTVDTMKEKLRIGEEMVNVNKRYRVYQ